MSDSIRVLLVDDDVMVLKSLAAFLEDEGFTVFSTGAGDEALKIMATERVDVAVVDIRLREMGGEQLVQRGREIQPAMKYLVHTGSSGYRLSPELASAGMTQQDVLYKPVRALSSIADAIRSKAGPS